MTRVGVLGLGRMGAPIAALLAERFAVTSFDPLVTPDGSVRDVAAGSDVLVTVLPGPGEVRAALVDALPVLASGSLWLDLSSNDPRVVDELVDAAAVSGVGAAAAPMSGGPAEAASGDLRFYVAAPPDVLERVQAALAPLGTPYEPIAGDRPSQAHVVKLLANGLWFGQVIAVTEALLLAQAVATRVGTPHDIQALVADLHRQALAEFGPVDGELLVARLLERRNALNVPARGRADRGTTR